MLTDVSEGSIRGHDKMNSPVRHYICAYFIQITPVISESQGSSHRGGYLSYQDVVVEVARTFNAKFVLTYIV